MSDQIMTTTTTTNKAWSLWPPEACIVQAFATKLLWHQRHLSLNRPMTVEELYDALVGPAEHGWRRVIKFDKNSPVTIAAGVFTHSGDAPVILSDRVTLFEEYSEGGDIELGVSHELEVLLGLTCLLTMAKVSAVHNARQELGTAYPRLLVAAAEGHKDPAIEEVRDVLRPVFDAYFATVRTAVLAACGEDAVRAAAGHAIPAADMATRGALMILTEWDAEQRRRASSGGFRQRVEEHVAQVDRARAAYALGIAEEAERERQATLHLIAELAARPARRVARCTGA
ncbi:uncharacterized protein LOC62_06G008141 [Vanrija pseudolonga]|uniref:Uncharacterized protein n=1 Tax=Vanrija pseudolonga TaxID=143232 RepID=A0AAF0YDY4_9TREE|nr:hypothetical protein LOC62_06G008141 [Vanrija pseudolonga]